MDRAERRHRTEKVRARRIRLYNQIDEWVTFHTEASRANYTRFWVSSWHYPRTDEETVRRLARDDAERVAREGKMRHEYVVGYRDDCYWWHGRESILSCRDLVFAEGLEEVGLMRFFRPWRQSHR